MNILRKQHRRDSIPVSVWQEAHRLFPTAVGSEQLYAAAFFGHSHPHTPRSPESVWRGLVRKIIHERTPR